MALSLRGARMRRTPRSEMLPHPSQLFLELKLTVLQRPSLHPVRVWVGNDEKGIIAGHAA
jgi:hypothetical protein